MRASFLRRLRSDSYGERLAAWNELHLQPETSHGYLMPEDRGELFEILCKEEDDDVCMQAVIALQGLNCACQKVAEQGGSRAGPTKQPRKNTELSLDDWLFQHFESRSALLGITEKNRRRDEDALAQLARRFPPQLFRDTDLKHVPLGDDSWFQLLLDRGYETILVVGRLWMFGQAALDTLQSEELRLAFPEKHRPPSLRHGDIHPDYHRIHEDNGKRQPNIYCTEENGDKRTDYGVIQVYPSYNGCRWMTTVLCAGCSTLGTLGAAWWLTHELWRPYGTDGGSPIPTPHGIGANAPMEALIRVQASSPKTTWRPSQIELARLYVGDYVWQPDISHWHRMTKPTIEIEIKDDLPVSLSIDGQTAGMLTTSQNFRLATQLALAIHDSESGSVSVESLAKNRYIWAGREFAKDDVKRRLHNLNRTPLKGLINIAGEEVRLDAKVVVKRL